MQTSHLRKLEFQNLMIELGLLSKYSKTSIFGINISFLDIDVSVIKTNLLESQTIRLLLVAKGVVMEDLVLIFFGGWGGVGWGWTCGSWPYTTLMWYASLPRCFVILLF